MGYAVADTRRQKGFYDGELLSPRLEPVMAGRRVPKRHTVHGVQADRTVATRTKQITTPPPSHEDEAERRRTDSHNIAVPLMEGLDIMVLEATDADEAQPEF